MKKVIEKIEKIKGVEKVTETGCNELTVQVEKKERAVECTNKEQLTFAFEREIKYEYYRDNEQGCIYLNHKGWDLKEDIECHIALIPFSQYLSDYNLKDEWEKYLIGEAEKRYPIGTKYISAMDEDNRTVKDNPYISNCSLNEGRIFESACCLYDNGKWATIIEPELELISGEIYYIKYHDDKRIVRYDSMDGKCCINLDSQLISDGRFINMAEYGDSLALLKKTPKPATNKQKAKLIKAELKNGYLWNGKDLIKYK